MLGKSILGFVLGDLAMRFAIRWTPLAVLGLFALPLFAADPVKKDSDTKTEKPADEKKTDKKDDKWILAGKVNGEIVNVDDTKKIIKIKVTTMVQRIDQNEVNAMNQAQVAYATALSKRPPDLNGAAQAQRDIATHQRNAIKFDKKTADAEYPIMDDPPLKVRVATPPVTFDDNGVIKKLTNEEIKKLKGDPNLPGFPGEFSDLKNGQMVTLTMMRNKDAKPPSPMPGVKPADLDLTGDYMPHISMVVVV